METIEIVEKKASYTYLDQDFEDLYERLFPRFARYAARMGGDFHDACDVFQDAMVAFHEKLQEPGFEIRTSPEAYAMGIARHLWLKKIRRDRKMVALGTEGEAAVLPADYFPTRAELRLLNFLERAGRRCMDLLESFYFGNRSLRDIASMFGFRSERSAAVQKYKCIEKLRESVKAKSLHYEDFNL